MALLQGLEIILFLRYRNLRSTNLLVDDVFLIRSPLPGRVVLSHVNLGGCSMKVAQYFDFPYNRRLGLGLQEFRQSKHFRMSMPHLHPKHHQYRQLSCPQLKRCFITERNKGKPTTFSWNSTCSTSRVSRIFESFSARLRSSSSRCFCSLSCCRRSISWRRLCCEFVFV